MREDLRRQYLKALNVPCLVPRFVLPGAALSRRCEMPAPPPANPASRAAPVAAPGALRQALLDPPSQRTPAQEAPGAEPKAPSAAPAGSPQHSTERVFEKASGQGRTAGTTMPHSVEARNASVRFSLTLCRSEGWLVVDEGPAPTPDYLALLANLLYACGHRATVQGEDFHWPPPLNRPMQLDLSAAAASQVLVSRLQTLHQRQPMSRVLLLGPRPPQLLGVWSGEDGVQRLDLPVSLWRAMAQPVLKRELWLQLAGAGWL